jgi:hypothetical protein
LTDLAIRSWNNTPISRRTTDGYVNATAMCKANEKRWYDYRESERCQAYLDALAQTTEIPVFELVQSRQGNGGGTWVHPQVAVDLARWISAPFAVWMDGWFLEELNKAPAPAPAAALPAERMLEVVERTVDIFERLGGLDQRDQLLFKDIVRSNLLRASSGSVPVLTSSDEEELTLSDAWLEVMGAPLPRNRAAAVGRLVAEMYREEFEAEPATRQQYVDGAPRKVKSYMRGWLIKAINAIKAQFSDTKD